jgi:hypothetical protein
VIPMMSEEVNEEVETRARGVDINVGQSWRLVVNKKKRKGNCEEVSSEGEGRKKKTRWEEEYMADEDNIISQPRHAQ